MVKNRQKLSIFMNCQSRIVFMQFHNPYAILESILHNIPCGEIFPMCGDYAFHDFHTHDLVLTWWEECRICMSAGSPCFYLIVNKNLKKAKTQTFLAMRHQP